MDFLKHIRINDHTIKLKRDKQPFFGSIYSLRPVELEILNTYIKTSLANNFIWSSKSSAGAPILFDKKSDGTFRLCVDYWRLNNITIKNQYQLSLIGKLLDQLGQIKRFTQFDLTNAYYRMLIYKGDE